jgi:hypothetical protein
MTMAAQHFFFNTSSLASHTPLGYPWETSIMLYPTCGVDRGREFD